MDNFLLEKGVKKKTIQVLSLPSSRALGLAGAHRYRQES